MLPALLSQGLTSKQQQLHTCSPGHPSLTHSGPGPRMRLQASESENPLTLDLSENPLLSPLPGRTCPFWPLLLRPRARCQ